MGWGPGPAGSRSCHDVAEVGPYEAVGRGPGHRQDRPPVVYALTVAALELSSRRRAM